MFDVGGCVGGVDRAEDIRFNGISSRISPATTIKKQYHKHSNVNLIKHTGLYGYLPD